MKKLIAGNWKMNTDVNAATMLVQDILSGISAEIQGKADMLVCPPFVYLDRVVRALQGSPVLVGAQDCSFCENGAHTGDVSASMLKDIGVSHVILGHSERRSNHKEESETVRRKAEKAHAEGLVAIICVGESAEEREQGREQDVVKTQLLESLPDGATADNTVIAYEPVWAIGTGKTATPDDAGAMHGFIRGEVLSRFPALAQARILYGGSMKPENAAALLSTPDVDGGLIGGASLSAESFMAIAQSA